MPKQRWKAAWGRTRRAASGGRNDLLNKLAFRLGRMIARGWIRRDEVEAALIEAMQANGSVADDGIERRRGNTEVRPRLPARRIRTRIWPIRHPLPSSRAPEHPKVTLAEVHAVFHKWFGPEYDIDVIDAVMATAAAERLAGDPLWLLVVSGPGNAKTETVQSLAGAGAYVTSTIASEGALLSASSRKSRIKTATGGLLRKIGDRGVLVIKDVTSDSVGRSQHPRWRAWRRYAKSMTAHGNATSAPMAARR